jgi:hypothetical protein
MTDKLDPELVRYLSRYLPQVRREALARLLRDGDGRRLAVLAQALTPPEPEKARRRHPVVDGRKRCGVCQAWKPASPEFFDVERRGGLSYRCKACRRAHDRGRDRRDRQLGPGGSPREAKRRAYAVAWWLRPENKAKARDKARARCQRPEERAKRLAYQRAWRARDPERAKATTAIYAALYAGKAQRPDRCDGCRGEVPGRWYPRFGDPSRPIETVRWLCHGCARGVTEAVR